MDDFVISNLHEARNEWCSRLVSIFTPLVIEGIRSIFNESWKLCESSDEINKYLMTFQNLLSRIPKWNSVIVEEERKRIIDRSGCHYLEDLITCVHIIQLKVLTCIRVGNKQKKIDISIPKLDHFIHKVYIHVARKVYTNVYLFEKTVTPLQMQKNNRELEIIVQECILTAIRESIPTEDIIRAYMDEAVEQEEEVVIENLTEPVIMDLSGNSGEGDSIENSNENRDSASLNGASLNGASLTGASLEIPSVIPSIQNIDDAPVLTKLSFNDYDSVMNLDNGNTESVSAPKSIERLEEISMERAIQRRLEEEDDLEDKIRIHTDNISLEPLDIMNIDNGSRDKETVSLDDIVELL